MILKDVFDIFLNLYFNRKSRKIDNEYSRFVSLDSR